MTLTSNQKEAYTGLRSDVISLIKEAPKRVLDVGCSNGLLLEYLKCHLNSTYVVGIEIEPELAKEASSRADCVIVTDLDTFSVSCLDEAQFDLIILADVLEHTKSPDSVLKEILKSAKANAQVLISLPNIQHITAIKNLLIGQWPQRERGLFDKTHLRFFTLSSIKDLAASANLEIEEITGNYRIVDAPWSRFNRLSKYLAVGPFKPFLTYQYVLRLRYRAN